MAMVVKVEDARKYLAIALEERAGAQGRHDELEAFCRWMRRLIARTEVANDVIADMALDGPPAGSLKSNG